MNWNEIMIQCDNCGHMLHAKKVDATLISNPHWISQWIPCSDRLPEKYERVLVTDDEGFVSIGKRYNDGWLIYDGESSAEDSEIIAWMPLPEAYKELS